MLTYLIEDINKRRKRLRKFRDYYEGRQSICFVGESLQTDFGTKLQGLTANRCQAVIDAVNDRLKVVGIEDDDSTTTNEQSALDAWREQNLDTLSRQVHLSAQIEGDAYVIAFPTADGIEVFPQNSDQIAVAYDDERPDQLYAALKVWKRRDGTWRANLYYRDRLEKYESSAKDVDVPENSAAWHAYEDEGDSSWPITYGWNRVPVFHFATNSRIGEYGRSDLADIIPLQDRLNQTLANEAVAEEYQGFRQRWATGIQPIYDADGNPINPFDQGADQLWVSTSTDTKFGEFSAADLSQLEAVAEGHELRIARTAGIPAYYVAQMGTPPSGESLKTTENRFLSKIEARQTSYGLTWADLLNFILTVGGIVNPKVRVRWKSPETRVEGELIKQALQKVTLGVSQRQALIELGYTDEQVDEFEEETAESARARQRLFDEGVTV